MTANEAANELAAPMAGVAVVHGGGLLKVFRPDAVEVVRRPKRLHAHAPTLDAVRAAMLRMSSEICGLRAAQEAHGDQRATAATMDGMGATFDPEDRLGDLERRAAVLAVAVGDERRWGALPVADQIRYCTAVTRLTERARCSAGDEVYAAVRS